MDTLYRPLQNPVFGVRTTAHKGTMEKIMETTSFQIDWGSIGIVEKTGKLPPSSTENKYILELYVDNGKTNLKLVHYFRASGNRLGCYRENGKEHGNY